MIAVVVIVAVVVVIIAVAIATRVSMDVISCCSISCCSCSCSKSKSKSKRSCSYAIVGDRIGVVVVAIRAELAMIAVSVRTVAIGAVAPIGAVVLLAVPLLVARIVAEPIGAPAAAGSNKS